MDTLHITNGDLTVDLLRQAGIKGTHLPWRDVLHMGPVPDELSLTELSETRARYIASLGWADLERLEVAFTKRDNTLLSANEFDKVILWFEHDLYDQLQLLQILSELSKLPKVRSKLFLINPSIHLGRHTPDAIALLLSTQQPVTNDQLDLAVSAWEAYRQASLDSWAGFMKRDTSVLPNLHAAIARSLGELPDPITGLTLTEKMILILVAEGVDQDASLFNSYCQKEQNEFHGTTGFYWYVQQMVDDSPPLLALHNGRYTLTEMGELVLAGEQPWKRHYSNQRWLGGYCISPAS